MRVQQRLARRVRPSRPGRDGAADGLRHRALFLLRARLQCRRRDRQPQGLLGRAGVRHDGGAAMIEPFRSISPSIRRAHAAQSGDAGVRHLCRGARQGDRLQPARRVRHQDHHARTARRQSAAARRRAARRPDQRDRHSVQGRAVLHREDMPQYAAYEPPLVVSISAPTAEGFAEPRGRADAARRRRDRGQYLLSEHRGGRQGLRDARRARPRRSRGSCAPRPSCRSGSS